MPHRLHVTISDKQYRWLDAEADRTSVSIAELVRRALDSVFGPDAGRTVFSITYTVGRRTGQNLDDV